MNKSIKKQIREITNLVMDLNDLGLDLSLEVGKNVLTIFSFGKINDFYLEEKHIFLVGEYNESVLQKNIDKALKQLRLDVAVRKC